MVSNVAGTRLLFLLLFIPTVACRKSTTVTVKGQARGSYTFETIFTPTPCSDLVPDDLSHLNSTEFSAAKEIIQTNLGTSSKCIVVFGVLVISNIPDHGNFVNDDWIRLFANTLAVILDKNRDGVVDDSAVGNLMRSRPGTTMAAEDGGTFILGRDATTTDAAEEALLQYIGSTTTIMQDDFGENSDVGQSMRAMTEEIFHTYQHKLGSAYPEVWGISNKGCPMYGHHLLQYGVHFAHGASFGLTTGNHSLRFAQQFRSSKDTCGPSDPNAQKGCDYGQSTLMKCAFRAQCNWYTSQMCCSKTGDSASGSDVTGGGCIWPGCAGIEWYYNLVFEYTETMYPGAPWLQGAGEYDMGTSLPGGNSFPQSKADVKAKLTAMGGDCAAVLANIEDPKYHQPSAAFDWYYVPGSPSVATRVADMINNATGGAAATLISGRSTSGLRGIKLHS